jgi:hypothetical protein
VNECLGGKALRGKALYVDFEGLCPFKAL